MEKVFLFALQNVEKMVNVPTLRCVIVRQMFAFPMEDHLTLRQLIKVRVFICLEST